MRNYYYHTVSGKIFTENEMTKAISNGMGDNFELIGKFNSRNSARKFFFENC